MGGSSSTQQPVVEANKDAFQPKQGKGEQATLQSRKQEQQEQVAAAKAARDALQKQEQEAKQQAELARL